MKRIPEAKALMTDKSFAKIYAETDFAAIHTSFVTQYQKIFGKADQKYALDLGCGSGDVTLRFSLANPYSVVHGVDGSEVMLQYAQKAAEKIEGIGGRVRFFHGILPSLTLPREKYDILISNSLLHHLHAPGDLWEIIRRYSGPGTAVFVKDLRRPACEEEARLLVKKHAGNEPNIFRQDLFHSLLAAFDTEEIVEQLEGVGLDLMVEATGDRHVLVYGRV